MGTAVATKLFFLMFLLNLGAISPATQDVHTDDDIRSFVETWVNALAEGQVDYVSRHTVGDEQGRQFLDSWLRMNKARQQLVAIVRNKFGVDGETEVNKIFPNAPVGNADTEINRNGNCVEINKPGYRQPFLLIRYGESKLSIDVSVSVFPPTPESAKSREAHSRTALRFFKVTEEKLVEVSQEILKPAVSEIQHVRALLRETAKSIAADLAGNKSN